MTEKVSISSFETSALDEQCADANEKGIEVAYLYRAEAGAEVFSQEQG